jgi:hypothetical protein
MSGWDDYWIIWAAVFFGILILKAILGFCLFAWRKRRLAEARERYQIRQRQQLATENYYPSPPSIYVVPPTTNTNPHYNPNYNPNPNSNTNDNTGFSSDYGKAPEYEQQMPSNSWQAPPSYWSVIENPNLQQQQQHQPESTGTRPSWSGAQSHGRII